MKEPQQERYVQKIVIHEKYNAVTEGNDIALLKVTPPVTCGDFIGPGCLPHFKSGPPRIPHTCYVTGWGYIKDDGEYMRGSSVGTGAHSPCWLSLHGKGHDVWLSCFTPLSIMNRVWAQTLSWLENSV